jgi:hypothetical protein
VTTFGDVNGDGIHSAADAEILLQRLVDLRPLSLMADMDGDGVLTNRDSILILGVAAEQILAPPDVRRLHSTDNGDGTISMSGTAGAVSSGAEVHLVNTRTNTSITAPIDADGSFAPVTIAALPGDRLTLDVDNSPARIGGVMPTPLAVPEHFTVGSQPEALASGDINGDTILDLVTANSGANSVSVLLGNDDGTFQEAVPIDVGVSPAAVMLVDLNGDGHFDLIVANEGEATVSVLLGTDDGSGTFQPAENFTVGNAPSALEVGDFNNDSRLDLAVANSESNSVSILLGNDAGTFDLPALNTAVGESPEALAAGNINDDEHLDLVVANEDANSVSVLLGNGDGTFQTASDDVRVGLHPEAVALQDVNGDSRRDLVVANRGSNSVSVLFGNGDGTFGAARHYPVDFSPIAFAIADLNQDERLDIIVVNENSSNLTHLLGDGTGKFSLPIASHQTGNAPTAIVVADFNSDDTPDVAVTSAVDNTVSILLNLQVAAE